MWEEGFGTVCRGEEEIDSLGFSRENFDENDWMSAGENKILIVF